MINPKPEDIGRGVLYRHAHDGSTEQGVITSFNDSVIFVRYGSNIGSQATTPSDLTWLFGEDKTRASS